MGERNAGPAVGPVSHAVGYAVARQLLEEAEAEVQRRHEHADHYARVRESEADLLIAKARRVLEAAEERAAVIVAVARAQRGDVVIDLTDTDEFAQIGHFFAGDAARLSRGGHRARLDGMLASAITHAVDDAFPTDVTA